MNGYQTRNRLRAEIASMLDHLQNEVDRFADACSDKAGPNNWTGTADLEHTANQIAQMIADFGGGLSAADVRQAAKEICEDGDARLLG